MSFSAGNIFRLIFRAVWFAGELLLFAGHFVGLTLRHGRVPPQPARSKWLQRCARRSLRVFSVQAESHGPRPQAGLLVCNHLSYLDVAVLASASPVVLVSKSEVKRWPVFGWCARLAGTLFVDRTRRSDVTRIGAEIRRVLEDGHVLVLFPEGTSSDGRGVLPFKSSLLEPIAGAKHPLTVGRVRYELDDGSVENDVCYWGDMHFLPHLVKLMTKKQVRARVNFAAIAQPVSDRKALARQLHAEVMRL